MGQFTGLYTRETVIPSSAKLWVECMASNQAINLVKSLLLQKPEVLTEIQHKLGLLLLGSGKSKGSIVAPTKLTTLDGMWGLWLIQNTQHKFRHFTFTKSVSFLTHLYNEGSGTPLFSRISAPRVGKITGVQELSLYMCVCGRNSKVMQWHTFSNLSSHVIFLLKTHWRPTRFYNGQFCPRIIFYWRNMLLLYEQHNGCLKILIWRLILCLSWLRSFCDDWHGCTCTWTVCHWYRCFLLLRSNWQSGSLHIRAECLWVCHGPGLLGQNLSQPFSETSWSESMCG